MPNGCVENPLSTAHVFKYNQCIYCGAMGLKRPAGRTEITAETLSKKDSFKPANSFCMCAKIWSIFINLKKRLMKE